MLPWKNRPAKLRRRTASARICSIAEASDTDHGTTYFRFNGNIASTNFSD
jgi:hypothetical protein